MSFPEALKAIPADLALHPNSKFKRSAQIAKLFLDEARGIVSMIPYGVRAKLVHKLTPKATENLKKISEASGVTLEKINGDLGLYKSVLSRMNAAKELQAEVLERERRKTAERMEKKAAKDAKEVAETSD